MNKQATGKVRSLWIPADMAEIIEDKAKEQGRSVNNLIVHATDLYIKGWMGAGGGIRKSRVRTGGRKAAHRPKGKRIR